MQWLNAHSGGAYWFTSAGFPFYRPAAFAVWDALHALLGRYDSQAMHTLSVGLHLANALLVASLAGRLSGHNRVALWAGLLFVAFPFSYQNVILAAALFHLLLVFGLLASSRLLISVLDAKDKRLRQLLPHLLLAWLLAFWGIFAHENGILALPIVGGLLIASRLPQQSLLQLLKDVRFRLALAPIALFSLAYGLMWATVPKANEVRGLQSVALDSKIGLMLQGWSYPIAALLRLTIDPQRGTGLALLSGALVLVLLLVWLWRIWPQRQARPLARLALLGLGWVPLVMLPAWLLLDVNYVLGSPRLMYLASVGVAWALGVALSRPLPDSMKRQPLSLAISLLGLALYVVIGMVFVRARVSEHLLLDSAYRDIGRLVASDGEESQLLLVNIPAEVGPPAQVFLLGGEGSIYQPDFVGLSDILRLNGFIHKGSPQIVPRRAADVIPPVDMLYAPSGPPLDRATLSDYQTVAVALEIGGQVRVLLVGEKLPPAAPTMPGGDFGNSVLLESADLQPYALPGFSSDGQLYRLDLTWQVSAVPTQPFAVFIHLLCDETLLAQADGPPLGRLYPFELWQPTQRWRDSRYLLAPPGLDPACLSASVGLFDPTSEQRLPVTNPTGITSESVNFPLQD